MISFETATDPPQLFWVQSKTHTRAEGGYTCACPYMRCKTAKSNENWGRIRFVIINEKIVINLFCFDYVKFKNVFKQIIVFG